MENKILEIANETQINAVAEAEAVFKYTTMIDKVLNSGIDENTQKTVVDTINELIADELNHQEKLLELYVLLTGIEPNKD